MPNIATVFKAEIARLARKEVRGNSEGLKKAVTAQRAEIASLKRRIQTLEAMFKQFAKNPVSRPARTRPAAPSEAAESDPTGLRFRASGMADNRKRLGLSASDFGLLVGATGQSIYAWEAGKAKPRPQALAAIAALRGIGKREVEDWLASLKNQ